MLNKAGVRRHRELVDLLLEKKIITQASLEQARQETQRTGLNIERALEKLGIITAEDIVKVQADALGLPYMDLSDYIVDAALVKLIPEQIARKHKIVPLFKVHNSITVGMVDPEDVVALDHIRRVAKIDMVDPVLVSEKGIQQVLDTFYEMKSSFEDVVKSIDEKRGSAADGKSAIEIAEDAPVIKLLNVIIHQAVKDRASDIHVEPEPQILRIRFRIDGLLQEVVMFSKKVQYPVISRIKILSNMDIAESRKPQDGRIRMKLENKELDIRVSTFPTIHGENVVMRLLDKSSVILGLKELGFMEKELEAFGRFIRRPNGIVLVTGPTGSGKTSTLYTALATISSITKNVVTIEDPVEYELPLIRQTQVNPKAGVTFADGLRGILRQDPDIIMVGEIRDKETVDVAIQAALTGHLVLATLHTNDAPSALTRLIDMGVEPFLVSSSVIGIVAQRLVRVICDKCKEKYLPPQEIIQQMEGIAEPVFYRGKGCSKCKDSGFYGRIGIFEVLNVDEELRKMIDAKKSADEIKKKAVESGMKTLRQDGLKKVQLGITIPEEVIRVTEIE